MVIITGSYRSVKAEPWPGGHGVIFAATSDLLPSCPKSKDEVIDSYFTLIGAHLCGIQMVVAG